MGRKILIVTGVILVISIYTLFGIMIYSNNRNAECNDVIELTNGNIINCKNFSIHLDVLSYRDCDYNKIYIPLSNVKSMRRVND